MTSLAQVSTRQVTKDLNSGVTAVVSSNAADAGVGLSPNIWSDMPLLQMMIDPTVGIMAKDFFQTVQATGFPYELTGTNGTFAAVASAPGTALLNCPGTDNDEAHLAYNNDVAGLIKCDPSHAWAFEARVKLSQVTAEGGVIVGLLEQAASADAILADGTMILTATLDWIGFQIVQAAAAALPWATSMQLAARAAIHETAYPASTGYIKLGMKSVPNAAGTIATVTFYVNGVALPDTTTTAATNFPLNVVLIPHFGIKTGLAAAFGMTINWWCAAQLK